MKNDLALTMCSGFSSSGPWLEPIAKGPSGMSVMALDELKFELTICA
jgi:hypothetical protein